MKKIIAILLLIFLISSPIISSLKITNEQSGLFEEINLQQTSFDPKIQEIIDKINETLVRDFLEYLVFEIGCRYTGTYGCEKAAKYIHGQFEGMGLQTRYQDWSERGNRWHPYYFKSQNVEATLEGTDPSKNDIIVFNAHYDTVEGTVGANDDGSGTVGVLAAAYALSQFDFKRTMKFVTFSGEEIGLLGSKAYAIELYENQTNILVEFNADMIGKAITEENSRSIGLSCTEDSGWIHSIMENMSKDHGLNFAVKSRWSIDRYRRGGSDFAEFAILGYETVAVWEMEGDPNMHQPTDNIDNVNISYLVNTTRHIAATMAILADMDLEYPQVKIANPRRGRVLYNDLTYRIYEHIMPTIIDETNIFAEVIPGAHPIEKVEFYYDDKLLFRDEEKPYEYDLNQRSIRRHYIKVVAYDTEGNTATDEMRILFFNIFKNN